MQPLAHRPATSPRWLALAALLVVGGAAAKAPVDLGGLSPVDYAAATAINAKGQVMGVARDPVSMTTQQVLWMRGDIQVRSTCCGAGTGIARALNASREAAGYADEGYEDGHWYWNAAGVPSRLPGLPGGIDRGSAYDLNDAGRIVGYSVDSNLRRHAVIWDRTTLALDLSATLGTVHSVAKGINQAGEVVGDADGSVFVWRNGGVTWMGAGTAVDINDSGLVAGHAPGLIPALWRNGVRETLRGLYGPVAYGHTLRALNNLGDAVGYTAQQTSLNDTAVLWRNGKAIDLGRYPGGTISRAYSINDKGQIVGEGNTVPGGPMRALRWTVKVGQAAQVELAGP